VDPLLNHAPFELGKGAADAEDQFPDWLRRVDVLLVDEQIASNGLEVLNGPQQVDQRAAEGDLWPRRARCQNACGGIVEHLVQARRSARPTGYTRVVVNLDHLPPAALGDLAQLDLLMATCHKCPANPATRSPRRLADLDSPSRHQVLSLQSGAPSARPDRGLTNQHSRFEVQPVAGDKTVCGFRLSDPPWIGGIKIKLPTCSRSARRAAKTSRQLECTRLITAFTLVGRDQEDSVRWTG
jgi:hypothetical protein